MSLHFSYINPSKSSHQFSQLNVEKGSQDIQSMSSQPIGDQNYLTNDFVSIRENQYSQFDLHNNYQQPQMINLQKQLPPVNHQQYLNQFSQPQSKTGLSEMSSTGQIKSTGDTQYNPNNNYQGLSNSQLARLEEEKAANARAIEQSQLQFISEPSYAYTPSSFHYSRTPGAQDLSNTIPIIQSVHLQTSKNPENIKVPMHPQNYNQIDGQIHSKEPYTFPNYQTPYDKHESIRQPTWDFSHQSEFIPVNSIYDSRLGELQKEFTSNFPNVKQYQQQEQQQYIPNDGIKIEELAKGQLDLPIQSQNQIQDNYQVNLNQKNQPEIPQIEQQSLFYRNASASSIQNKNNIFPLPKSPSIANINTNLNRPKEKQQQSASKDRVSEYSKKLYDQNQLYKEKKLKLAEEVIKKEMSACTFTPKVNHSGSKRSSNEFIEKQTQFLKYVEEKRQLVRNHEEERKMSEVQGGPKILAKSKRIIEQKRGSEAPAHERLYHLSQKQNTKDDLVEAPNTPEKMNQIQESAETSSKKQEQGQKESSFKPKILQRSKSLVRNAKVGDILYQDAQRRQLQKEEIATKNRSNSRGSAKKNNYASNSSHKESILISKFSKEVQQALVVLKIKDPNRLVLSDMFEIVSRLGFVRLSQPDSVENVVQESENRMVLLIWQLLGGQQFESVTIQNLVIFLNCILGLSMNVNSHPNDSHYKYLSTLSKQESANLNTLTTQSNEGEIQTEKLKEFSGPDSRQIKIGWFEEQKNTWIVDVEDKKVIRKEFEGLYRNRLASEELRNNKHDWDCSFQPQVLKKSEQLAANHRDRLLIEAAKLIDSETVQIKLPEDGRISHSELLHLQKLTYDQQAQKRKEAVIQEEMKECSFKPKLFERKRTQSGNLISDHKQIPLNINSETINASNPQFQIQNNIEQYSTKEVGSNNRLIDLFNYGTNQQQIRRDKTSEEFDLEKINEEFTFKPNTLSDQPVPKDAEKSIERMRSAQREKEQLSIALSRGYDKPILIKEFASSTKSNQSQKSGSKPQLFSKENSQKPPVPQILNSTKGSQQNGLFKSKGSLQNENSQYNNSSNLFSPIKKIQKARDEILEQPHYTTKSPLQQIQQEKANSPPLNRLNQISQMINSGFVPKQTIIKPLQNESTSTDFQQQNNHSYYNNPQQKEIEREERTEKPPVLFVDVNLGLGRSERIAVYEGDRSEDLANHFAIIHNLDEETKLKFKELLDIQIDGLLTQIDEEEVLSSQSEQLISSHFMNQNQFPDYHQQPSNYSNFTEPNSNGIYGGLPSNYQNHFN